MKKMLPVPLLRTAPATIAACAVFCGAVVQAQPSVDSSYPDGSVQFQSTNTLTYSVSSAGLAPGNISLQLLATNLDRSFSSQTLTSANGLTVGGTATARMITAPLSSNKVYLALLTLTDANGTTVATNLFDTITPSYTWECEDWDYDNGKYFDNPQTNAYAGLSGVPGVDAFNPDAGGTAYRSNDTGNPGNEINGDIPRVEYTSSGLSDYDIGWMTAGQPVWANYTRHYPAGKWNIFLRAAGNTGGPEAADLYEGGTNGTPLGRFSIPNNANWQVYSWVPMTDIAGNLIEWDSDGSAKTLTLANNQGNWNGNLLMLIPVDPNYKPKPFISNIVPDGTKQLFPTNTTFSFDVNSVPGITPEGVVVTLNGITPYGLTFTGGSRVLHGSFPIAPNVPYRLTIQMTDANGTSTYSADFSASPPSNYTWECEDYDYDGGKYFDNPQTNAYAGLSGIPMVDVNNNQTGGTSYRGTDSGNLPNEVAGDLKRVQYTGTNPNDYDIGWTAGGVWANYTRTYPQGQFNVMMRAAGNTGGNDRARLLRVTSGVGTDTQTTEPIGQFNVPNTGGWQIYSWAPLVDASGNLAVVTNTGGVSTFRMQESAGGWNGNFFMLVPVDTIRPRISQLYPDGAAMFTPTNKLSFVASSPIGIEPSGVSVILNDVRVSNLVFTGPGTNLSVAYAGLQPDTAYRATLIVNTTNNDPYILTYTFDTFQAGHYTVEAEDYDYESGKFINNPPIDAYAGLSGVDGIDAHNVSGGGTDYRPNDAGNLGNEIAYDAPRAQYTAAGTNDYDIGWTATGQWGNYTRTYPAGTFHVFMRGASPNGQANGASLLRVTSGVGTANQTTLRLGTFNFPATGGWQAYTFLPLVDATGSPVIVTNTDTVSTLRLSQENSGWNANFLMFVPVQPAPPQVTMNITRSGSNVTISWTPQGGTLESSPALGTAANWQPVPAATNPMTIPIGPTAAFYRVR